MSKDVLFTVCYILTLTCTLIVLHTLLDLNIFLVYGFVIINLYVVLRVILSTSGKLTAKYETLLIIVDLILVVIGWM